MQAHIKIAEAKKELVRINEILEEPVLLIGGLAVQQYSPTRDSVDLDLVCDSLLATKILKGLYSSEDWDVQDHNADEYRPAFIIRHKVDKSHPVIHFGPKIIERGSYRFLEWGEMLEDAEPFRYQGERLSNILVPTAGRLCFSKLVAFLGRRTELSDKRQQDLEDIVELSNHSSFNLGHFYTLIRRHKLEEAIVTTIRGLDQPQRKIFLRSNLSKVAELFSSRVNPTDLPTIWVIGSTRGLSEQDANWARGLLEAFADQALSRRFKIVLGRSQLLDQLSNRLVSHEAKESDGFEDSEMEGLARRASRAGLEGANPVIILGSLRRGERMRAFFIDTIGRIPDLVLVVGGDPVGRGAEEVQAAIAADIPVLPIPQSHGLAAIVAPTVNIQLKAQLDQLERMTRGVVEVAETVCDLIEDQVRLSRQ